MRVDISSEIIEAGKYKNNTAITEVTLLEGVKAISEEAFYGCSNLTKINFPKSLEFIGDSAFRGCVNLTIAHSYMSQLVDGEIQYDSNIEYVGSRAFYGVNLGGSQIVFGSKLKHIREESFREVSVSEDAFIAFVSPVVIGRYAFYGSDLAGVGFDTLNTTAIEDYAFAEAKNVVVSFSVMPKSSIGNYSFYNCSFEALHPFITLSYITSIGDYAFSGSNLVEVEIMRANKLGKGAFQGCEYLTQVLLSPNILKLEKYVFERCGRYKKDDYGNTTTIPIEEGGITINCSMYTDIPHLEYQAFEIINARPATIIVPDNLRDAWEYAWSTSWVEDENNFGFEFEHHVKKSSDLGFFIFTIADTLLLGKKKKVDGNIYENVNFIEWIDSGYSRLFALPYNTYIPEYLGKKQGSIEFKVDYDVATGDDPVIIYPVKDRLCWVVELPRTHAFQRLSAKTPIEPNANYGYI